MKKRKFSRPPEKALEELDAVDLQSRIDITFTKPETQSYEDGSLKSSEYFQEMPLVLVNQALLESSYMFEDCRYELRKRPDTRKQINEWLQEAKEEDERLFIERKHIAFSELYLPRTEEGKHFYRIAREYGKIPRDSYSAIPRTPEMACWLKTLCCFYQSRAIALAHRLHGVISDPLSHPDSHLARILTELTRHNISICTDGTVAWFRLLEAGWPYLEDSMPASITTAEQLFLEVERHDFESAWQRGPGNPDVPWVSKDNQRYALSDYRRLFCYKPWDNHGNSRRSSFKEEIKRFRTALSKDGLPGHVRLILMDHHQKLKDNFSQYELSLNSKAQDVYIDDFYWRLGKPFKQEKTSRSMQVKAVQHPFGYLEWIWA